MSPDEREFYRRVAYVLTLVFSKSDDTDSDIRSSDVDGKNGVMALEHPFRHEVNRAYKTRVIWVVGDRNEFDVDPVLPKEKHGSCDHKLAHATMSETATDRNPLRFLPRLLVEEFPDHVCKTMREFFDGSLYCGRR